MRLPPIQFEHKGIGRALSQERFAVPLYQRHYAWGEDEVNDLLYDLNNAISSNQSRYFLGFIILSQNDENHLEVCDGQQRLATTTILLAAIRDYALEVCNDARFARSIDNDFLFRIERGADAILPNLNLNADDAEFFRRRILLHPGEVDRDIHPNRDSHRKMVRAAEVAFAYVRKIVEAHSPETRLAALDRWIKYIEDSVQIVLATVPEDLDPFTMFETLNDRGVDTSVADHLKTYLFKMAGTKRINEAQQKWAQTLAVLETHGIPNVTVNYIRHMMITMYGHTRQRDVQKRVKEAIRNDHSALQFLDELSRGADDYAAMLNPSHPKWEAYGERTRCHLKTIKSDLEVSQVHPLMFAIVKHFTVDEARKALRLIVAWSVRFAVVGGRGGLLDENYARAAHRIGTGLIKTTNELARDMNEVIPPDATFQVAFSEARVKKNRLARYYLRVLENEERGENEPELIPNEDPIDITLEHVMPEHPDRNWPSVSAEDAQAYCRRIGNLALMKRSVNSLSGNASFADKKAVIKPSAFLLTSTLADADDWGIPQIIERQKHLARLAVRAWHIKA